MWYIDTDNIVRIEGLRNVVTDAYVNNATITGVLYNLPAQNPDVAAAVDKGSGKVGIPCTGHGLTGGTDVIRIERSVNYNTEFLLDASTTVDELVITATYVAEVFTGNEFIYHAIVGTIAAPITFAYEANSNGNYVGKIPYTTVLLQDESYVLCVKEVSGSEQVLAKIVGIAGFQGL